MKAGSVVRSHSRLPKCHGRPPAHCRPFLSGRWEGPGGRARGQSPPTLERAQGHPFGRGTQSCRAWRSAALSQDRGKHNCESSSAARDGLLPGSALVIRHDSKHNWRPIRGCRSPEMSAGRGRRPGPPVGLISSLSAFRRDSSQFRHVVTRPRPTPLWSSARSGERAVAREPMFLMLSIRLSRCCTLYS